MTKNIALLALVLLIAIVGTSSANTEISGGTTNDISNSKNSIAIGSGEKEDEEEPPRRSSRSSGRPQAGRAKGQRGGYKPKNFADMDEDDDLDFEFLDLK